jgi:predicted nuclease of restriction endonuclease-like (RecB) superfamily
VKNNIINKHVDTLYKNIASYVYAARHNVMRSVNAEQVKAYWLIGRDIVEEEQRGKERAEYGALLLQELSSRLTMEFHRGFSVDTLERARKFYLTYQGAQVGKSAAVRRKLHPPIFNPNLGWIHYRALISESRSMVRAFYELEAIKNCWSGRELERQMGSLLFERLLKSKDKKGLMKLACKGQELVKPENAIKDPVVLEFLNLPESDKLVESKLEDALISNMQNFLLELGRGFAFVGRQNRITLDGDHFYVDLVFYNTHITCVFDY